MTRLAFETPWLLVAALAAPAALVVLRRSLVDTPRAQLLLSAAVRAAILLLLAGALAEALWTTRTRDVAVTLLVDLSDSAPESAPERAREVLGELAARAHGGHLAGLAVVAETAVVAIPVGPNPDAPEAIARPEQAGETDLEAGLLRAREMMPPDKAPRVVLLSDGNETRGDALAAAKRLAGHGVRIYTMAYRGEARPEVLLEDLAVPAEVDSGQSFAISAVAHATQETPARFTLYREGFRVDERELTLAPGATTLAFEETQPQDGLTRYELQVQATQDYFADNNTAAGIVAVTGEPRVLLLEGVEREARPLARTLEAEGVRVDIRDGRGMPGSLDELAAFDAVLLSDVPATDLSVRQMELLRTYVSDLGGGVIMLGGDESFGMGGYYRTALDEILPVRMRAERKTDMPSLALMLVIDRSGSMQGEKIELAKEAAIAALEVLGDRDYVGVIAFDGEPHWAVDLQSASQRGGIVSLVEMIQAGGGTSMYPAMVEAHYALAQTHAALKHAVVLTDGHSMPGDFTGITDAMAADQITVSTVAVGEGADVNLLQEIARWGGGRFYFTADPFDMPQIFTKETMTAARSSLIEEPFLPMPVRTHPAVQGIDWEAAPFLFGYVTTTAKPTSEVLLATERGDPLLATWRYGLGKTAAFMSDAKARWAADWLRWPGYGRFWAQLVRDTMWSTMQRGNETQVRYASGVVRLTVDSVTEEGAFVDGLETTAQAVLPDLGLRDLTLEQIAPGRYEIAMPIASTGSYLFRIRQTTGNPAGGDRIAYTEYTRGFTLSYRPEYRRLGVDEAFLRELATVTGGTYAPDLDTVFTVTDAEATPVRRGLWPYLVATALLLFVVDVALRRLDLAGYRIFAAPERYG